MKPKFIQELNNYDIEQAKKDMPGLGAFSDAFGITLQDAGRDAFRNIFGEANSLLEQFIQNMINEFARLGEQELASYIFKLGLGFLTGGTSSIIDEILNFGAGGASGHEVGNPRAISKPKQTMIINMNMGNQNLGQVVAEGYDISIRRRYLT